jgi:hypothetical protein
MFLSISTRLFLALCVVVCFVTAVFTKVQTGARDQSKKQAATVCGEISAEGERFFILPLSKVPIPLKPDFAYSWALEISNGDFVSKAVGSPVVLEDWTSEKGKTMNRVRLNAFHLLSKTERPTDDEVDSIIFGDVQNPGQDKGFIAKVYSDGNFVAADSSGKCLAFGSLDQLKTDFGTIKRRLVEEGLIDIPNAPLTVGSATYRTRFIELNVGGISELRSDAPSLDAQANGVTSKKREAFARIFDKENKFITSLINAGFENQPRKNAEDANKTKSERNRYD